MQNCVIGGNIRSFGDYLVAENTITTIVMIHNMIYLTSATLHWSENHKKNQAVISRLLWTLLRFWILIFLLLYVTNQHNCFHLASDMNQSPPSVMRKIRFRSVNFGIFCGKQVFALSGNLSTSCVNISISSAQNFTLPERKFPSYSTPLAHINLPVPCISPLSNKPSYLQSLSKIAHPTLNESRVNC